MPVGVLLSNGKAIPGTAMELYRKSGQRNGTEPASQGAALTGTVTTCSGIAKRDSATAKLAKDTPRNSSSLRRQAAAGQGEAFTSDGTAKKSPAQTTERTAAAGLTAAMMCFGGAEPGVECPAMYDNNYRKEYM